MTREEAKTAPALFTKTAWEAIGWDDGYFRIKGGRTVYEAVSYSCARNPRNVTLSRLVWGNGSARQVNRYVDPDTVLEFLEKTT